MSADVKGGLPDGPWTVVHNSWEFSTVYDVNGSVLVSVPIHHLTTEETQDHYEAAKDAVAQAVSSLPDLLEALKKAEEFIDGIRQDLHSQRAADWHPEGVHDAASSMSESMRLIGNSCADFTAAQDAIAKAEGPSS